MGDRVLMQIVNNEGDFGPVVYGHDAGVFAPVIVEALVKRMKNRTGDMAYWSGRLVQEVSRTCPDGDVSLGMWNAEGVLTEDASHGDAGVVLINADTGKATYLGGYYTPEGNFNDDGFDLEIINKYRSDIFGDQVGRYGGSGYLCV